jgi:hypothetical protein
MKKIVAGFLGVCMLLFVGCDCLKTERETSVCDVPEAKTSVFCKVSAKIDFDLEDVNNLLMDANQFAMLSAAYDYDGVLNHLDFVRNTLVTGGGNVAEFTYTWFFNKIFDDETKSLMACDIAKRRLQNFMIDTPITDYDVELLLRLIHNLEEQTLKYRSVNVK